MPGINVGIGLFADGFLGGVDKVIGKMKSLSKSMSMTAKVISGVGVALGIITAIHVKRSIEEFIRFEQQLANLAKVMDDMDSARTLARSIGDLSMVMPVASAEMFEVAETAARLGIRGTKNLREFTRVATMMGAATDLAANQAADAFARILKQTNTPIKDLEMLASVVNDLANNMATTDSEIVEAVRRAAPELSRIGLKAPEIAALAASLNEVSESASRAGTRLRMFAQNLSDPRKIIAFANAVDETPSAFKRLLEANPVEMIQRIVRLWGEGGDEAQKLSTQLDSRVRGLLSALSQNAEGTTRALELMKKQLTTGGKSLQKEFDVFADTTAAAMQKHENAVDEMQRRTGEKVIQMTRWWVELKLAIVDAMVTDLDPLHGIASNREADEFRDRLMESLAEVEPRDVTFTRSGTAIFVETEGVTEAREELEGLITEGLQGLEFGVRTAYESLDTLLTPAMERATTAAERANIAFALSQDVLDFYSRLGQVTQGASQHTMDVANTLVANIRRIENELAEGGLADAEEEQLRRIRNGYINLLSEMTKMDKVAESQAFWNEKVFEFIDGARLQIIEIEQGARAAFIASDLYINAAEKQADLLEWWDRLEAARRGAEQNRANTEAAEKATRTWLDNVWALSRSNEELREENRILSILNPEARKRAERQKEINDMQEEYLRLGVPAEMIAEREEIIRNRHALEDQAAAYAKITQEREKALKNIQDRVADLQFLTLESQIDFVTQMFEGMADSAVDAFNKIIEGSGGAGEAVVAMLRDIANELLKRQILGFLMKMVPGMFNLGGGDGIGGLGPMGIAGDLGMAEGGPISANKLAIVGEEGPELFVPRVSGNVVPNDKLKDMSGGDTYNVSHSFTIQAMDGESVRRVLAKEKKFITGMTVEGISRSRALKRSGLN